MLSPEGTEEVEFCLFLYQFYSPVCTTNLEQPAKLSTLGCCMRLVELSLSPEFWD